MNLRRRLKRPTTRTLRLNRRCIEIAFHCLPHSVRHTLCWRHEQPGQLRTFAHPFRAWWPCCTPADIKYHINPH
jgi:hypothetical protein